MPSRLIQGLDNLDACSQFSDSATLHTLTRMGALQKEVYFSRSESNFNNFDTISYGNSSTCCCDAEIKVNLHVSNSICALIIRYDPSECIISQKFICQLTNEISNIVTQTMNVFYN